MLRLIFVLVLIAIGTVYALQAPFYALLFYIANAYFRPEDWVWQTDFLRSLNLSFLCGIFVSLFTLFSRPESVINGRVALLGGFLVHTFLSTLFSEHFAYSWNYWIFFLKTIIITYLILLLVTDAARFRLLLLVMMMALGVLQARQGWLYLLFPPDWEGNPNKLTILGDNNGVAIGMLMLVPVAAYLAQTTQHTWARRFYWVLLIGCLLRALTTYSRGGFLACAALGFFYLIRSRQKVRVLLGMLVIIAAIAPALPDSFWDRMNTIKTYDEEGSAISRLHFWDVATEMAKANPLFGVGYHGFNPSYNAYDFSHGEYGTGRSVHSSYYSVLAELGYIGMGIYLLILFCAMYSCRRVQKLAKRGRIETELGQAAFALEMSLIVCLVGGSFVIWQYNEMFWHFIGLTLALDNIATQRAAIPEGQDEPEAPVYSLGVSVEKTA